MTDTAKLKEALEDLGNGHLEEWFPSAGLIVRAAWDYLALIESPEGSHISNSLLESSDIILIRRDAEGNWPWAVLETVWVHSGGSAEGTLRGFDALAESLKAPE